VIARKGIMPGGNVLQIEAEQLGDFEEHAT
jgi:hypothetical protein